MEQCTILTPENTTELEVVQASYVTKRFTNYHELFKGFNHLHAITFSCELGFVEKIVDNFDTVDIIIGCEAMVKFDIKTIMAFQTNTLQFINKRKKLVERAATGTLTFWMVQEILSHQKIYILTDDAGHSRVITGSPNFSGRAFSGNQRENITCFENDSAALENYLDEFDLIRTMSTKKVTKEALFVDFDNSNEVIDHLPIVQEIKTMNAGIILDNDVSNEEGIEFAYNMQNLSKKYAAAMPQLSSKFGKKRVTAEKVLELKRNISINEFAEKEKQAQYPCFHIDYEDTTFTLNDRPVILDPDPEQIRKDLTSFNNYFAGFDEFIGNIEQTKSNYYRMMNYMLLSPFIARLRYTAYQYDFPLTAFPIYAVLNGIKGAGKSTLVKTIQHIMFGCSFPELSYESFTKSRLYGNLEHSEGVPILIDDITNESFNAHAGKIVKYDVDIARNRWINHPVVILTANDIESIKPEFSRRVCYFAVDAQLTNVTGNALHKKTMTLGKQISTSFYQEYLRRMFPKVLDLIEQMENFELTTENDRWFPDIFAISSDTIIEIYSDFDIELPSHITPLKYSDYFEHNTLEEQIREKIIFEWNHNRDAFKVLRKQNLLEYTAGEKVYQAKRVRESMPPALLARVSGRKVVMRLDEAEKFFGIHFKNKLF